MMPAPILKFATGVAALQLVAGASLRSNDGESGGRRDGEDLNARSKSWGCFA